MTVGNQRIDRIIAKTLYLNDQTWKAFVIQFFVNTAIYVTRYIQLVVCSCFEHVGLYKQYVLSQPTTMHSICNTPDHTANRVSNLNRLTDSLSPCV
ncbi:hypothetical protein GJ496_005904 [Pomphorhynchus laevis]|nr:hypothetical protein GJ496_005904 [Pomphorhynchus laevis]